MHSLSLERLIFTPTAPSDTSPITDISIARIRPMPTAMKRLSKAHLEELMVSITNSGLLQPILVRPVGDTFEVVFGLHRFEACRRLGWKTIKACVKEVDDKEAALLQIIENIQRRTPSNPIWEGKIYRSLLQSGWTMSEIAKKIGKSDSYVSDRIGIATRLHPELVNRISTRGESMITISHAEQLAKINDGREQLRLARLIEKKRLSVRHLELLTRVSPSTKKQGYLCFKCSVHPKSRRSGNETTLTETIACSKCSVVLGTRSFSNLEGKFHSSN